MDKTKRYNRKLRQVVKRLDKLTIEIETGDGFYPMFRRCNFGSEISPNKISIAKEILSKFGINEPKK